MRTNGRGQGPDPIDIHVGRRIKLRRTIQRISQDQLAGDIGVTFQQVQKYESGHNRVSASRLYDISRVLSCPIQFFFDDAQDGERGTPGPRAPDCLNGEAGDGDPLQRTETLELVRSYWRIQSAP